MQHQSTKTAPHGALWRRGERRHRGISPLRHEELVVLLGRSGRGQYLLEGSEISIRPSTLVWAPPGSAHMLVSDTPGFDMWVILAHPSMWPNGMPPELQNISGHRDVGPSDVLMLNNLAGEIDSSDRAGHGFGLMWWLWRASRVWQAAAEIGARRWHPAVARVALSINQTPSQSIARHCADCGLTRGHVTRLFKEQTGQNLMEFRARRLLEKVDIAHRNGTPLLNAALDAGFGSYAQFFRVFRSIRGRSPRAYYADGWVSADTPH